MATKVTWLGHASLIATTGEGDNEKVVVIDPWYDSPVYPSTYKPIPKADIILVTHGHFDHSGSAVQLSKDTGALIIGSYELTSIFAEQGAENIHGMNKGGTYDAGFCQITVVAADHSSSCQLPNRPVQCTGPATGFVVKFADGTSFYHAGDTNVFTDMGIISELYAPKVAFLPIGGNFTMGPREAAYALGRFLKSVEVIVPIHFQTFPLIPGSPSELQAEMPNFGASQRLVVLEIGQTFELGRLSGIQ